VHCNITPGFHGVHSVSARHVEGAVLVGDVVGNAESLFAARCGEWVWSVFCGERLDKGIDTKDGEELLDDVSETVWLGMERFD